MGSFTTRAAGMRRARLLPALALLLGALSLLPAAPAQAQVVIQPPTNLVATAGNGKLVVTWTPSTTTTVTGYEMDYTSSATVDINDEIGTSHTTHWVQLPDVSGRTTATATASSLTNSTTYRVRVRAYSSTLDVESVWVETSGTPGVLAAPADLDVGAHPSVATSLNVRWTAVEGAIAYEAEWRIASTQAAVGSNTNIATTKGTSSDPFTITGLTTNTAYEVRVRAKNADAGTWSGWVSGTPMGELPPSRWPRAIPQLSALTLTAGGEAVELIQGNIHPHQATAAPRTGFEGDHRRYMAVVPYDTTEIVLTPGWRNAWGAVSAYTTGVNDRTLFGRNIEPGEPVTVSLAPSTEGGRKLPLWQRHTDVVLRLWRPSNAHQYVYRIRVMQGGPIPVSLSVEGAPDNLLPYDGTAKVTASIPHPLPFDTAIPLTVSYVEAEKGDLRFRPDPDRFPNQYYGPDRPVQNLAAFDRSSGFI